MVREDKNITLLLKALEDKNVQKKLFQILDAREYNRASKEKETENVIAHTSDKGTSFETENVNGSMPGDETGPGSSF